MWYEHPDCTDLWLETNCPWTISKQVNTSCKVHAHTHNPNSEVHTGASCLSRDRRYYLKVTVVTWEAGVRGDKFKFKCLGSKQFTHFSTRLHFFPLVRIFVIHGQAKLLHTFSQDRRRWIVIKFSKVIGPSVTCEVNVTRSTRLHVRECSPSVLSRSLTDHLSSGERWGGLKIDISGTVTPRIVHWLTALEASRLLTEQRTMRWRRFCFLHQQRWFVSRNKSRVGCP